MAETPAPLAELDELLAAIRTYDDPRRAAAEWKQVYRLLQQTDLPAGRFQSVVGMRDVEALATLIDQLRRPDQAPQPGEAPDAETCRRALRAFRKRAKLTRLDDDSKLGRGPLSKGTDQSPTAIIPPAEWPGAVWQQLARDGRLRYVGDGMYELPSQ